MTAKKFHVNDIGILQEELGGRNGYEGDDPNFKTNLIGLEFTDSCEEDDDATALLTTIFRDPEDGLCYRAECYYDKESSGPAEWEYREGDMVECTRMELKDIVVESWVESK